MYGCNNHIGCLSVSAYRIGNGLNIDSSKINADLEVNALKLGRSINIIAERLHDGLGVSAKCLTDKIAITCSLVCTVNKDAYLKVMPDYVWLTPDMLSSAEFDILSNVSWNID